MANLKASILKQIKLKASTKITTILKASTLKTLTLSGSVSKFVQSFTIKAFIQPVVNIYSKINMERNGKANIESQVEITANMMGIKPLIDDVQPKVSMISSAFAYKPMIATVNLRPIFGYETTLGLLDNLTLGEMDDDTLGELEFTEGVRAEILKNSTANIEPIVSISSDVLKFRYRLLGEMDNSTLGSLDNLTLGEIDIIIT